MAKVSASLTVSAWQLSKRVGDHWGKLEEVRGIGEFPFLFQYFFFLHAFLSLPLSLPILPLPLRLVPDECLVSDVVSRVKVQKILLYQVLWARETENPHFSLKPLDATPWLSWGHCYQFTICHNSKKNYYVLTLDNIDWKKLVLVLVNNE